MKTKTLELTNKELRLIRALIIRQWGNLTSKELDGFVLSDEMKKEKDLLTELIRKTNSER